MIFEYRQVSATTKDGLIMDMNELGLNMWEAISVIQDDTGWWVAFMRKPLPPAEAACRIFDKGVLDARRIA